MSVHCLWIASLTLALLPRQANAVLDRSFGAFITQNTSSFIIYDVLTGAPYSPEVPSLTAFGMSVNVFKSFLVVDTLLYYAILSPATVVNPTPRILVKSFNLLRKDVQVVFTTPLSVNASSVFAVKLAYAFYRIHASFSMITNGGFSTVTNTYHSGCGGTVPWSETPVADLTGYVLQDGWVDIAIALPDIRTSQVYTWSGSGRPLLMSPSAKGIVVIRQNGPAQVSRNILLNNAFVIGAYGLCGNQPPAQTPIQGFPSNADTLEVDTQFLNDLTNIILINDPDRTTSAIYYLTAASDTAFMKVNSQPAFSTNPETHTTLISNTAGTVMFYSCMSSTDLCWFDVRRDPILVRRMQLSTLDGVAADAKRYMIGFSLLSCKYYYRFQTTFPDMIWQVDLTGARATRFMQTEASGITPVIPVFGDITRQRAYYNTFSCRGGDCAGLLPPSTPQCDLPGLPVVNSGQPQVAVIPTPMTFQASIPTPLTSQPAVVQNLPTPSTNVFVIVTPNTLQPFSNSTQFVQPQAVFNRDSNVVNSQSTTLIIILVPSIVGALIYCCAIGCITYLCFRRQRRQEQARLDALADKQEADVPLGESDDRSGSVVSEEYYDDRRDTYRPEMQAIEYRDQYPPYRYEDGEDVNPRYERDRDYERAKSYEREYQDTFYDKDRDRDYEGYRDVNRGRDRYR